MARAVHRRIPLRAFPIFTLLAMAVGFWLLERSAYNPGFGWHYGFAAGLVVWYLGLLVRDTPAATLTSFYQIYYGVGVLASAAIIATGAEMIEIGAIGGANGSFWLMLGFFILGLEATVFGFRLGAIPLLPLPALRLPTAVERGILLAFVLPTLLLALYVFVLTGGPVLRGVDRVTFWRSIAPAGTTLVPSLVTQTFFFAAFFYLWRLRMTGSMTLVRLLLLGYLLAGLLVLGEKFSLFIAFLNIWLIVLVGVLPGFRFGFRHVVALGALVALLVGTVAVSYILDSRDAGFIMVRAALQAQLLWSVAESSLHAFSALPLRPECYFGCDWYESGRDYISVRYLPPALFDHYDQTGSALSGFMPALPILTFGLPAALALHMLICICLGILQRKLTIALNHNQPVHAFLLFKLQFGGSVIWFAAMETAIPGLLTVLAALLIYRLLSATRKQALA